MKYEAFLLLNRIDVAQVCDATEAEEYFNAGHIKSITNFITIPTNKRILMALQLLHHFQR